MLNKPNRIRELRKKAGLSQEKLGDELGCNKSKISKLENGNQELTQNWMVKIARALSKHLDQTILPADLLPTDQTYADQTEQELVNHIRQLNDAGKEEFNSAMFDVIKNKS